MQEVNNIVEKVIKTEYEVKSFIKDKTSELWNSSISGLGLSSLNGEQQQSPQRKTTIMYDLAISKSGKIRSTFELKPFISAQPVTSSTSKQQNGEMINLARLLTLINIDILQENDGGGGGGGGGGDSELKSLLNALSALLNQLKREKSKRDKEVEHLCYIGIIRMLTTHLYNNNNFYLYITPLKDTLGKVSCDLFAFEYMTSLFTLACQYICKGNEAFKTRVITQSHMAYKDAIDVLNEMVTYIEATGGGGGDESETWKNTERFLYVKSPSALSSSSSHVSSTYVPFKRKLTDFDVNHDFSTILGYFGGGGKESILLLIQLIKAQRFQVLYAHACGKIGIPSTTSTSNEIMTTIQEGEGKEDLYQQLFQISKSVLTHYEEALNKHLPLTQHYKEKTRLYYYVLFISHLWYCQHHYHIALFDEFQYTCTFKVIYAQQALVRITDVINAFNAFVKHALFTVDLYSPERILVSNIISGSLLSRYHALKNAIITLAEKLQTIVYDDNSSSTVNTIVKDVIAYQIPLTESTIRKKIKDALDSRKISPLLINVHNQLKIAKRRFLYHNQYDNNDNDDDGGVGDDGGGGGGDDYGNDEIGTTINGNRDQLIEIAKIDAQIEERRYWLEFLQKHYDHDKGVFVIERKDVEDIFGDPLTVKECIDYI
jgi:hypothetical protein